jgi:glycosyltransferase involved in cell wall biosynthesis
MQAADAAGGASQPIVVSVVIPTLNAAATVGAALASVRAQTYPAGAIEILVVDGGSTDVTLAILAEEARRDPRIRVLGGPGVNCPAALNIGIAEAIGSIVWYLGGHGEADREYVARAVARLTGDARLGCVGGTIVPVGEGLTARSNRIARFSVFGVGRGVLTTAPTVHDVETVQWGAYRREALLDAGLFDPELQFGEDEELNYRLRRAGWRILYDPSLVIRYVARPTFRSLFRQYRNYGRARVRVVRKHPSFLRPKHLAPAAVVVAVPAAGLALLGRPAVRLSGALLLAAYGSFLAGAGSLLAVRNRFPYPHYLAASLLCLHVGYGIGILQGLRDLGRRG